MTGSTYPAARQVAKRIEERLAKNSEAFQKSDDAPRPDATAIEEIVTAAFWASLRREEGKSPRISLAFVPPELTVRPLHFAPALKLGPEVLARLAPAVERPGIHLGVWRNNGEFYIWGTTRSVPKWCFVLEVVAAGLLVVKYRSAEPSVKFANVAVLEGAEVKFLARQDSIVSEPPSALSALLDFYASAGRNESDNILVRLGVSMRDHGRGGTLLVTPDNSEDWRGSVVQPILYTVDPPFAEIGSMRESPELLRSVEALAGLTAVDGATVISDHFKLLAFGVKIVLRHGSATVNRVLVTEPVEESSELIVEPSQLGGARHLSAAQFVQDQRNAIALVASQDGKFTAFAWSPLRNMVHGHRLESLLL